jgi:hypothetical protein
MPHSKKGIALHYIQHRNYSVFKYKKLPESLIDTLLKHLKSVNPQHRGTLDNIDYGIQSLLEAGKQDQALDFLEQTLLNNEGQLFYLSFLIVPVMRFSKIGMVFSRASPQDGCSVEKQALCEAVADIIQLPHGSELRLSIDASEINFYDTDQVYFSGPKGGWLSIQQTSICHKHNYFYHRIFAKPARCSKPSLNFC